MDYLPREKYLNLISKARYAINPSQREGFGIFIAEAMAIGVPAIVSKEVAETMDAPIVREVIDGLFLVKRIEIQTWNDVIKEYINKLYTN
jgi:glycosyltransferase involved in cell wall biosynthesis